MKAVRIILLETKNIACRMTSAKLNEN